MDLLNLFVFHLILVLSAFTGASDGYYESTTSKCIFSSPDLSDMVFIQDFSFNKDVDVHFNSSVGVFVGYTEPGIHYAQRWNSDTAQLESFRLLVDAYCKPNAKIDHETVLEKVVQPHIRLSSVKQAGGRHPAVLVCSAYDFYPKRIKVSWLRDGKPVTSDVTSTEELANGDWFYQIHSHLEYTPKSGEKISCVVEHASFNKPMIKDWDPSLPESERNKIVIGASGLVLGIIIAAAGLIYYKKKSAGRILVPH